MLSTTLIILEQSLTYLPLAFGAYISISLMKLPDLSIESAYTFGAILAGTYQLNSQPSTPITLLLITIILALIGGAAVGTISSLLTQVAKIPHLLSSILTVGLFHGINQAVMGSSTKSLTHLPNPLIIISTPAINQELITLGIIAIITTLCVIGFLKTQLGHCIAIYGNNPHFFEHHKISGAFIFFVGVLCANGLAGLSGYMAAQTSSFVDITMGTGISLFSITALIIGRTIAYSKKTITAMIPLSGITGYFIIQQLLLACGFDLKYFTMIQAIIVLSILIIKYRKTTSSNQQTTDTLGV